VVTVRDPGRIFHRSFSPLQHRLRKSGHVSPPPTHPRHHSRKAVPIRAGRAKYLRDIVGAGVLWRQQSCCQPPFCRHTNTSADLLLDRDSSLVRYAPFEAKVCHTSSRRCIYPCTQGHEPEGSMKLTGLARL
jgi:hypothetical protein